MMMRGKGENEEGRCGENEENRGSVRETVGKKKKEMEDDKMCSKKKVKG